MLAWTPVSNTMFPIYRQSCRPSCELKQALRCHTTSLETGSSSGHRCRPRWGARWKKSRRTLICARAVSKPGPRYSTSAVHHSSSRRCERNRRSTMQQSLAASQGVLCACVSKNKSLCRATHTCIYRREDGLLMKLVMGHLFRSACSSHRDFRRRIGTVHCDGRSELRSSLLHPCSSDQRLQSRSRAAHRVLRIHEINRLGILRENTGVSPYLCEIQ